MGSSVRLSSSEINNHLQRHADSGLSISDYCNEHGLKLANFYSWRSSRKRVADEHGSNLWVELTRTSEASNSTSGGLVPVTARSQGSDHVLVEFMLPGGIVLRVRPVSAGTS